MTQHEPDEETEEDEVSPLDRLKNDPEFRENHNTRFPCHPCLDMPVLIDLIDEDDYMGQLRRAVEQGDPEAAREAAMAFSALCVKWERNDMKKALTEVLIDQVITKRKYNLLDETAHATAQLEAAGAFEDSGQEETAGMPTATAFSLTGDRPSEAGDIDGDPMVA